MRVTVLGTGAADGLPQAFCRCDTCTDARRRDEVRAPGGALVNGSLLIDPAPGLATAAARAEVDLTAVTTVLVSHSHQDHWDPSFLLHRQWVVEDHSPPMVLAGPTDVIEQARHWLSPEANVSLHEVRAGDGFLAADGAHVSVLPSTHGHGSDRCADLAVLYAVTDPQEARLLYGADTGPANGPLLTAVTNTPFDLVLLELTFGATGPTTPGHLDHTTFPEMLIALREVGAVTDATTVVPIHLSHHNPPQEQLARFTRAVGARLVPDGTTLEVMAGRGEVGGSRRTLILGGARSGKSSHAERLAASDPLTVYLATGWPIGADQGADWDRRILSHRERRPASWRTIETIDLAGFVRHCQGGETLLIDCLALWVTRLVDTADLWQDSLAASCLVTAAVEELVTALSGSPAETVILVSNDVGSGVVPASASGRLFRDLLGQVNSAVADCCDDVVLMVAGRAITVGTGRQERESR